MKHPNLSNEFYRYMRVLAPKLAKRVIPEYRFCDMQWRFDFAFPSQKVAVECDGMVWQAGGGRHNTDADREKLNTAAKLGWCVLRFSGKQIRTDPVGCINILEEALEGGFDG